ncbi:MAG: PGF-pre-PGF domain-containing protein [Candidatus Woesearchaeota archaeon]
MKTEYLTYATILLLTIFSIIAIDSSSHMTGAITYNSIETGKYWEKLSNTEPTKFIIDKDDFGVTEIWLNVNNPVEGAGLKLYWIGDKDPLTPSLGMPVYKYYQLDSDFKIRSELRTSKVLFRISKEWLADKAPEYVVMKAFDGEKWIGLTTQKTGVENNVEIEYEAELLKLDKFYAIATKSLLKEEPMIEQPAPILNWKIAGLIIVIIFAIALFTISRMDKKVQPLKKAKKAKK